jgi:16S rRNA processing protein RimM
MNRDACVELGYLSRAHGLRGEVKVRFDVHDIQEYADTEKLWLARKDQPLKPYKVEQFRILDKEMAIVAFEGISDRNQADALIGQTVYFPEAELPALAEDHFFYFEAIGYQVVDAALGPLGTVEAFVDSPGQDLMVMAYQGSEVLVPVTDAFVLRADHQARTLHTALPAGLLEMYLGTEEPE